MMHKHSVHIREGYYTNTCARLEVHEQGTCFWADLHLGIDFFTHNLATQPACIQVGDLL